MPSEFRVERKSNQSWERLGDFTATTRLLPISALALGIRGVSLLRRIGLASPDWIFYESFLLRLCSGRPYSRDIVSALDDVGLRGGRRLSAVTHSLDAHDRWFGDRLGRIGFSAGARRGIRHNLWLAAGQRDYSCDTSASRRTITGCCLSNGGKKSDSAARRRTRNRKVLGPGGLGGFAQGAWAQS